MGYVPDLHKIWVGTSDQQLMALSNEFPGFYRYALIMEEASEAERNKASRPYDGMAGFSEEHKQRAAQLLVTAANLERGYQAFRGSGNLQVFQPQVNELGRLASTMAVQSGWLQKLSTRAGCGTQGIGVRERSVRPPYRAHQAACRLIVETDDGNFWGSGLQPPIALLALYHGKSGQKICSGC
jgi:hypothetical protein